MLPNLIIIGAAKCGTTALHQYLDEHPAIYMSKQKELNFFSKEHNWSKGQAWYESHFPAEVPVRGEASPRYTCASSWREIPGRMHELLPDTQLIYMVRDPIERLLSHYVQQTRHLLNPPTLEAYLFTPTVSANPGVDYSKYFEQTQAYLRYYDPGQLHVLTLDDLRTAPAQTMAQVFDFLGVDASFQSNSFSQPVHQTAKKRRKTRVARLVEVIRRRTSLGNIPVPRHLWERYKEWARPPVERPSLDAALLQRLIKELKPDIDHFRDFTGRDFAHWQV